jgi:hypothetical protein
MRCAREMSQVEDSNLRSRTDAATQTPTRAIQMISRTQGWSPVASNWWLSGAYAIHPVGKLEPSPINQSPNA